MNIIRLPHDAEHKRELFGLIGEYCASAEVRASLGGPISSDEQHVWFVALQPDGAVAGFAAAVPQSNARGRIAHLYITAPKFHALEAKLLRACEKELAGSGRLHLSLIDYARRESFYHVHGWTAGAARGQFTTYTKEVKP